METGTTTAGRRHDRERQQVESEAGAERLRDRAADGFAMAAGIEQSRLAASAGSRRGVLRGTPPRVLVPGGVPGGGADDGDQVERGDGTDARFGTGRNGAGAGIDPYWLLIPATIMTSFAFMLPVATPPNGEEEEGWAARPIRWRRIEGSVTGNGRGGLRSNQRACDRFEYAESAGGSHQRIRGALGMRHHPQYISFAIQNAGDVAQ